MLDLRGLLALEMLDRLGTISAAASTLGYTASAVSQQLSALEREVGVLLIARGPRSAALNAAGKEFLSEARDVLSKLDVARSRAISATGRLSGRVVVATIPSLASFVAATVARVRTQEPLLDVVLLKSSARRAQRSVTEESVDLAVVDDWGTRSTGVDARITVEECFAEPVVLALHHSLFDDAGADWIQVLRQGLDDVPLLTAPDGNFSREFSDWRLESVGLTPRVRWEFDGLDTIGELVARAAGVAFLPASVTRNHRTITNLPLPSPNTRTVSTLRLSGATPARSGNQGGVQLFAAALSNDAKTW